MLTNEAFARLVAEDVKNRVTDEQRRYLRLPENLGRWQRNLVALLENLAGQLSDLSEKEQTDTSRYQSLGEDGVRLLAEMQADTDQKRKRISRFRYHVEARLDEATRLIASSETSVPEEMAAFLQKSIEKHRELINEADIDPSPIDEALWAALDGYWKFDDIDLDAV